MSIPYSLYGASGSIGSYLHRLYKDLTIPIDRNEQSPDSSKVIYLISTTTNSIDSLDDIQCNIDTNITILMDRLRASYEAGVKEFNFISSWYVYGKPTFSTSTVSNGKIHVPFFRETDHCNPTGFYSITKRTAEQLVIEFCDRYQINWRIIRLSNVYGYDSKSSSKKNILHYLINKLRNNDDVALYGITGPMWRDYVHIHDVSRAIIHLCQKSPLNNIYNVGSGPGGARCLEDLVSMAKNHLKSESEIEFIRIHEGSIAGHIEAASLANDKLLTTGFRFEIPIEKGLLDLCNDPKSSTAVPTSAMKKLTQPSSI